MIITRRHGEGQGECRRCAENGIWNRHWMGFLYQIEGYKGSYCAACCKEIVGDNWKLYKKEAVG